jgi:tetratricopeptide (TPR) repeat protein
MDAARSAAREGARLMDWDWSELLSSRGMRLGLKVAGVVLVVAVLGLAGWLWFRAEDARGQAALAASTELVQLADGPQASPDARGRAIAALQQVLAQHGRSSAAVQAAYELGNLQFQAGDYAAARRAYELALAKGASGSLRTLAASGVGYTWEAEKNYASAVTAYEAVARAVPAKQFFFEDALLDLARAQALAGKPAEAVATYERVLKDVPETRRAPDIRARIAALQIRK